MSAREELFRLAGTITSGDRANKLIDGVIAEALAEFQAERHSTNEALDDAVRELRVQRDRIAELEAAARKADVDFFQPGQTYTDVEHPQYDWRFRCDTVTTHPEDGERTALGWRYFKGVWEPYAYGEDDWDVQQFMGKTAVSNAASARQLGDPHTSPLHHDYAVPRDLPTIPAQRDEEAL